VIYDQQPADQFDVIGSWMALHELKTFQLLGDIDANMPDMHVKSMANSQRIVFAHRATAIAMIMNMIPNQAFLPFEVRINDLVLDS
jgi:hypothetical protein